MTGFNPARHMRQCPCPVCQRRRENRQEILWTVIVVALLLVCGLVWGCNSPAPRVEASQPTFDQVAATGGVLQKTFNGGVISAHARERYNALIEIYGREFLPPLQRDSGITPRPDGTNHITNEAWENFKTMNAWRRMGRVPGTTKTNP